MQIRSKAEARRRADQIAIFRAELAHLEQEQVVSLDPNQQTILGRYHEQVLQRLVTTFDLDLSDRERHLGPGMRIGALFCALVLACSLCFFYVQYWGHLPTQHQVSIIVTLPFFCLLWAMTMVRIDRSGFLAQVCALMSLVCCVVDVLLLDELFNLPPSPSALLFWAVFALVLAYATQARMLLVLGLLFMDGYLAAQIALWNGQSWLHVYQQLETLFPLAVLFFLVSLVPHRGYPGFSALYRIMAMLLFFIPVLVLSEYGTVSLLDGTRESIETTYRITGVTGSVALIGLATLLGWPEVVSTGSLFLALFLAAKLYHWGWERLPMVRFSLVLGASVLLMLLLQHFLRRLSLQRKAKKAL